MALACWCADRCFHGRNPFGDGAESRKLWRQWVWTADAKAVPMRDGVVGAKTSTPWELIDEKGGEHQLAGEGAAKL